MGHNQYTGQPMGIADGGNDAPLSERGRYWFRFAISAVVMVGVVLIVASRIA
jgi:hypothetical protein